MNPTSDKKPSWVPVILFLLALIYAKCIIFVLWLKTLVPQWLLNIAISVAHNPWLPPVASLCALLACISGFKDKTLLGKIIGYLAIPLTIFLAGYFLTAGLASGVY